MRKFANRGTMARKAWWTVVRIISVALAVLLLGVGVALAASVQKSPTANTGAFYDPTGAYADGGTCSSGTYTGCARGFDTWTHQYFSYGHAVPSGAKIDGIVVRLDGFTSANSGSFAVELSWNNGTSWTTTGYGTGGLTTSEATYTMGGPTNTWGHPWTSAEINNSFRVRLTASASGGSSGSRWVAVDWLPVTVYYTMLDPTAVTLSSFAAKAGGLASPLWLGVAGLTVLAAGTLFWAKRRSR